MDRGRYKPWTGRSGRLLRRFNRDWVEVRRSLAERERAASAVDTGAGQGRTFLASFWPPPTRIAVAPSLW